MKRAGRICFVLLLIVSITTGCWNYKEPDKLAFITGTGLDLTKEGQLEVITQIAVPAGIGGGQFSGGVKKKQGFHVLSATGKNISDAAANIQSRLSRTIFVGHRDIYLIGKRMAERGLGDTIDPFIRNAESELRSMIYVVKNGNAKDILSIEPFFDPFITTSLSDEQAAIGLKPYLGREYVIDVLTEGIQPLLPAVSLYPSKHYRYTGTAIFNKDNGVKLVGFLNKKESYYANWIKGRLTSFTLTSSVTKGDGNVSLRLEAIGRRIRVKKAKDQIYIDVHLTGKGTMIENHTNLDPSKHKDLQLIEDELGRKTQKSILQLIKKVQKKYKMDIFGFGESVHQQYPQQWKTLNRNWTETFPQLHVSVKTDIQCKDPGQTNSSIP